MSRRRCSILIFVTDMSRQLHPIIIHLSSGLPPMYDVSGPLLWLNFHSPLMVACSRRSDSGERCEVKRSAKKIKAREGERWGHLSPQSPSTFYRYLYFAPLSTIWTLGTGYANGKRLSCYGYLKTVWLLSNKFSLLLPNLENNQSCLTY